MRHSHLLPFVFLFAAATAFAQDSQRYLDNFDTARGVQVNYTRQPSKETSVQTSIRVAVKHYLPSPQVGDEYQRAVASRPVIVEINRLVQRTALVAPSLNVGYARDPYQLSRENVRLMMAKGSDLKGYSTGDDLIDAFIVDSSRRYDIDPLLIYAQMNQESSFKRRATSNKGASGLMQLMPATARRLGVTDIYDPQQNIEGGVKYMRILLDMFDGDLNLALAGYNAGEGAVMKYGYQIPPYNETQDYVRRISGRYSSISATNTARTFQRASYRQGPAR